jgi:rare lipoprotein A
MKTVQAFIVLLLSSVGMCANAQTYTAYNQPAYNQQPSVESGTAMYYADYLHGQSTAMGEIYSKYELTCSHRYHPKGTLLRVTRMDNGKSVTVRVNDKGTFSGDVVISLSLAAAMQLEMLKTGKAGVTVEMVGTSSLNPVNPNRESLVQRDALAQNYQVNTYNNTPAAPAAGDRLTPRGSNGASFQWDTPQPKSPQTPANYETFTPRGGNATANVNTGYGIQIGSYGVYDNADRQISNLRKSGVNNAFVKESITANGARLFRVMVGSFASRTEAQDYLQSLRNQYVADGIVVDLSK